MSEVGLVALVGDHQEALAACRLLVARGFRGRKYYTDGKVSALIYRRDWAGCADVVQVFGPLEAEAYRASDRIPFHADQVVDLVDAEDEGASWTFDGTVHDAVTAVLELEHPGSHFPTARHARAITAG